MAAEALAIRVHVVVVLAGTRAVVQACEIFAGQALVRGRSVAGGTTWVAGLGNAVSV